MSEKKVFVVIPTIRSLDFLKKWGNEFKNTYGIIVEDRQRREIESPSKYFKKVFHYCWEDIEKDFGEKSWIFPRKNAGIRSYGFYKAYQLGATYIITLDDDCFPTGSGFVKQHINNLNFKAAENWFSTYPDPKFMYTRGVPYSVRDKSPVMVSHGLWSGALDLDAKTETQLKHLLNEKPYPPIRQIVPREYFFPMCSMNLAFRREATPLMYFPPMGKNRKGDDWEFDRYDDIWAGIFAKKVMDHLGWSIVNGSPFVRHKKASIPKHNLTKETAGMAVNEYLWKAVRKIDLEELGPVAGYQELTKKMQFPEGTYFRKLKLAMNLWSSLFK